MRKLEKHHADDRFRANRETLKGYPDLLEKYGSKLLKTE